MAAQVSTKVAGMSLAVEVEWDEPVSPEEAGLMFTKIADAVTGAVTGPGTAKVAPAPAKPA